MNWEGWYKLSLVVFFLVSKHVHDGKKAFTFEDKEPHIGGALLRWLLRSLWFCFCGSSGAEFICANHEKLTPKALRSICEDDAPPLGTDKKKKKNILEAPTLWLRTRDLFSMPLSLTCCCASYACQVYPLSAVQLEKSGGKKGSCVSLFAYIGPRRLVQMCCAQKHLCNHEMALRPIENEALLPLSLCSDPFTAATV